MSFTAIAKRVGELWQDLPAEEKEAYESEASSAKERYHTEMAEYKTTKSYREYQQYLADFKAKNSSTSGMSLISIIGGQFTYVNAEDKRPKLAQEETATSTSSGSVGSYRTEPGDFVSGTADEMAQRIASSSSGGLYSTASALSSPASTKSWPPVIRTGVPFARVASGTSPTIVSPSIPSALKFPSHASQTQVGVPSRHAAQRHMDSTSPDPGQYPSDDRESWPSLSHASNTGSRDPRSSHSQTSSLEFPRRSGGAPSSMPHNASDSSSKSSVASAWSANSSIFPPTVLEEPKRTELPLPPLAALSGGSHAGSLALVDPVAARRDIEPLAGRSALLKGAQHSPLSSFDSSPKGMKFESLQLPLPYNISFGQRPLPRSERDVKLANIFDLQDIPGERKSFKDLTLQQQHDSSSGTTSAEGVPEPRHPPHVPRLPSLPAQPCEEVQNPGLHPNADPLSVLAYAGRLVGRENRGPL